MAPLRPIHTSRRVFGLGLLLGAMLVYGSASPIVAAASPSLPARATQLLAADARLTPGQRIGSLLQARRAAQAAEEITALMNSQADQGQPERAQRWVPWLLWAQAQARTPGTGAAAAQAYSQAFTTYMQGLDDLAAAQSYYWFVANLDGARSDLQQQVSAVQASAAPTSAEVGELLRQASFVQVYQAAQDWATPLLEADQQRRFIIDDSSRIDAGDGVLLSAVVARPRGATMPLPTALLYMMYTDPVGNRQEAMLTAARGYVGLVVDPRGKGKGTGTIAPYEHDGDDAAAAVQWASEQPWSDGRVVMYGGSYSGFAAWAAAGKRPPALKAIAPYVAAIPGLGLPMENNVFLNANYAWPFYVATTPLLDRQIYSQRERWSALAENWYTSGKPYRQIDQIDGLPNPWLQRWLQHPAYDGYWQAMVPYQQQFAAIDIPVLSITGYYDDGQVSALHYYREHLRYRPRADHTLVIGPYDHGGAQSSSKPMELRGYTLDPVAQFDTAALTFAWFDHVLRGAPRPALLADKVNYQLMGTNRWGHAASLDSLEKQRVEFHLGPALADGRRVLQAAPPRYRGHVSQQVDLADRSVQRHRYYPWPIVRDGISSDTGLVFVSAPLEQAMDLAGSFDGTLKVRINKRDVDLSLSLYEEQADGQVMQLSYYLGRASYAADMSQRHLLQPDRWQSVPIQRTRMTARRLQAGSRLVLVADVLMDAQHQVNMGTGKDVSDESVADAGAPLTIEWHSDSVIRLPMRVATDTK